MDMRKYYARIAETAKALGGPYQLLRSEATDDGGCAGVLVEVETGLAARMLVDGKARLATEAEKAEYAASQQAAVAERKAEDETGLLFAMLANELPKAARRARKVTAVETPEE